MSRPHKQPEPGVAHHEGRVTLCLACLLFSVYLLTFSGVYHSSDEMSMLAATDSLARRGTWDIELLRWMGEQQGSFGPDGHLYSRKGIGTTLAALPLYWLALQWDEVGNVQAAMLTNGLVTALTGALIYRYLRRLRYGRGPSLFAALGFGLGTMAWPYARYLFSESLAGLGLMASAYGLLCFGDRRAARRSRIPAGAGCLLLAGAGLGVALLARLNNAIVAPFLGLLLLATLYRLYGRRWPAWIGPLVLFALPVLLSLALAAWYNWHRFGNALTTGYLPEERFATPFFEGFYGLLLSPGKGLLWYNPLLFAALAGWPRFFRQHRGEALLALAMVLANVVFYAPWYLWWAGHGWGPRFLVSALPFAALPLAPALEIATRHRALAAGLAALTAISLAVQGLGVAVNYNLYLEDIHAELGLYHPATLFDPAYSPLLRQWAYLRPASCSLDLAWMRNCTVNWPLLLLLLTAVLVAALGLAQALGAWRGRRARPTPWTGIGLALLLALVAVRLLLHTTPTGDVAQAARELEQLERPGEAALLAEPDWTEGFQDAYDGHLPLWGVPGREQLPLSYKGTWQAGRELPAGASQRFQAGETGLALFGRAGRLPAGLEDQGERLAGSVELAAAGEAGTTAWRGETWPLTLYWRALAPLDRSYTIFVQLVDKSGTKAGQVDRLPCGGGCPTTAWQPGDLIGERYEITIRPDAPPGRYGLIAGLYDLATGVRLPLVDAGGNVQGDSIFLDWITVR